MKTSKAIHRSPVALAILSLLIEEPMHPYRMQQLLKERGKHDVVNVHQRASIYQTIERLSHQQLIEVQETIREEGRPDKTVYAVTEKGRVTAFSWMKEIISLPVKEYPEFPAALSFLPLLDVEVVIEAFERRVGFLRDSLTGMQHQYEEAKEVLPRVLLLDLEYRMNMFSAEIEWVRSILEEIKNKNIDWNLELLLGISTKFKSENPHHE
ncbi:PadR family transcriptional regulator [Cohnella sp. REN36]|uniref:PadR family transcriptional regulator n=1 Tax=Cohnella sp. REN36 TaxID=2887347 RepID=UPI001D15646B|nr:PadR family transcriptional regulator [Cohnella sp. REN36]MCC3375433.1 PadR family transcriptional regulator [Cohnella sp. REN36]